MGCVAGADGVDAGAAAGVFAVCAGGTLGVVAVVGATGAPGRLTL